MFQWLTGLMTVFSVLMAAISGLMTGQPRWLSGAFRPYWAFSWAPLGLFGVGLVLNLVVFVTPCHRFEHSPSPYRKPRQAFTSSPKGHKRIFLGLIMPCS